MGFGALIVNSKLGSDLPAYVSLLAWIRSRFHANLGWRGHSTLLSLLDQPDVFHLLQMLSRVLIPSSVFCSLASSLPQWGHQLGHHSPKVSLCLHGGDSTDLGQTPSLRSTLTQCQYVFPPASAGLQPGCGVQWWDEASVCWAADKNSVGRGRSLT